MFKKIKEIIDAISKYLKAVQGERKKISWPTPQELKASTIVVIITLVIVTSFLWLSDLVLTWAFGKIINLI